MSFTQSTSPDITEGLPFLLSAATETERLASEIGVFFDCTIGGVGFKFATSDTRQYQRQTLRPQKEQFDSSREAGEQTLSQYWLRSQTSWHLGAGIVNYEPGSEQETQHRFADSLGVDVWTEGEASLLRKTVKTYASTGVAYATGGVVDGADVVFTNTGGTVRRSGTPYSGTTAALSPVVLAGAKILVGTSANIMAGDASGSTLANLWTGAAAAPRPWWVKSRIIAAVGPSLYELTLAGGAWPVTSLFTHPDTGWTWTAVAEAPSAILAAGRSNGVSAVYRFALEDAASGSTPELSQAFQATEFPPGEEVLSLHTYLGRYVGIGTTKGLRVGIITDAGQLQYGPLLFDAPVTALTAGDRFLYGAVTAAHPDGKSGAVRVDLSNQIGDNTLRFPYAWDARTGTAGTTESVALLGVSDRVLVGVSGEGVYLQSDSTLETSGWIDSGRIRFSTVEPKSFQLLDLTARVPAGGITVEAVQLDARSFLGKLTSAVPSGMGIAISRPSGTFEYLTFRFTFEAGATSAGPVMESYQVKALPTPRRQRIIQMPLLCLDQESDRNGTPYGHEGYGWERVSALEELEEFDGVVSVQDHTSDETFQALIEQVTFTGQTPDDPNLSRQGYVQLLLRKL